MILNQYELFDDYINILILFYVIISYILYKISSIEVSLYPIIIII